MIPTEKAKLKISSKLLGIFTHSKANENHCKQRTTAAVAEAKQ
jgi:hypothetical protein